MNLEDSRLLAFRVMRSWLPQTAGRAGPLNPKKTMKNVLVVGIVVLAVFFAVELTSSYVLFRYFASENKSFTPAGSSTYQLINHMMYSAQGQHMHVRVSSDRFPLFIPDKALGFVMNPGDYHILETYDHQKHMFHLQVTQAGLRATSYRPVAATHRLFVTGDSSMFGWGVNDEQTIPWLLQSRMPHDQVLNLSLNSYSTIQTLRQLTDANPKLGPDDTVVLLYHPATNDFNLASPSKLDDLMVGYELQLGDAAQMRGMSIPYGTLNAAGELEIRHVALSCAMRKAAPDCQRPPVSVEESRRITERAFDDIIALHPGHLVVAFVSGPDNDPVIAHLKARNVVVADLRLGEDEPDARDEMPTDKHAGPFWQYRVFDRLLTVLQKAQLVH